MGLKMQVSVVLRILNPEAAKALLRARKIVKRMRKDYPWLDDLSEIDGLLKKARDGLEATRDGSPVQNGDEGRR